ncbi:MAG: sulfite exporter TauE/SafE family protein [Rickettsiales bacterium]
MHVYLPIAEMPVNMLVIFLFGGITGVLSGMFGVGGGFLMTPMLIFYGVPAPVAVASSANQIIGSSFSGFLTHWRRGNVDVALGAVVIVGGVFGSVAGVALFSLLKKMGQIDLVISLCYVTFLGGVGLYMAQESIRALRKKRRGSQEEPNFDRFHKMPLPFKRRFERSGIEISVLFPVGIGFFTGILVSLMGIGGGFVMIPAMIYLLGMPTSVVIGTSLFQIIFITVAVTFMQAVTTHSVDVVLASIMLVSAVMGAQIGARIGSKLPAENLRMILALLVLAVAGKLAFSLFAVPADRYVVELIQE